MLTREQVEALPHEQFVELRRYVMSISTARLRNAGGGWPRVSLSARLAAMAVGDTFLEPKWTSPNQLNSWSRYHARKRLRDPNAQWVSRSTNHGIRVTRIR